MVAASAATVADGALAALFAPLLSASAVPVADAAESDTVGEAEGDAEGVADTAAGLVEAAVPEVGVAELAGAAVETTLAEEPIDAPAEASATEHDWASCMLPDPSANGVSVTVQVSVINPWSVW